MTTQQPAEEPQDRFAQARRVLALQYREYRPCGTEAAYRRHLRWGDKPCEACKTEHRRINTEYVAQRRRAQAREAWARDPQ